MRPTPATALHAPSAAVGLALAAALLALPAAACGPRPASDAARAAADGPAAPAAAAAEAAAAATASVAVPLRIHDVQGAAHRSPLAGTRVAGITGIVTAVHTSGFTLQEPDATADDRPETSEGLLVYVGARPEVAVGDEVSVSGTVLEYRPDDRAEQLTVTEIGDGPQVTRLARGRPLPAPVVLGRAGRVPPDRIHCDDAAGGDLDLGGPFDPEHDGLDFLESLEGMRVAIEDAVALAPTSARRELWVLGDGGALASGLGARGGLVRTADDAHPERLLLDSSRLRLPSVDAGARFPGTLVGVLGYAFGNYRVGVESLPAPVGGVRPDAGEPPAADGELLVASFNLLNLSARTEAARVAALARQVVEGCGAPDLLALQELQDDSGPADDGTTSAALILARLVAAIEAAGGPAYRSLQIAPQDGQDGGQPGGNIRPALLYRADRGLQLVERGAAGAADAVRIERETGGARLSLSPGRIAPHDPAFADSRKPLAAEFRWRGRPLFVVANHWNSKGGDQPLAGRHQPPARGSEAQRIATARVLRAFADELLAAQPGAQLIVLGDLNDVPRSAPLELLTGAGAPLADPGARLPAAERFSYLYEGNGQQLDHILLSPALLGACTGYRIVHLNAEFAAQASDHDPCVARLRIAPD